MHTFLILVGLKFIATAYKLQVGYPPGAPFFQVLWGESSP